MSEAPDSAGLRISAFRLMCRDVDATAGFYASVLDARPGPPAGKILRLSLGLGAIELAPAARASAPAPSTSTAFQHLAIVVSNMGAAMARLAGATGWTPISRAGPERLPEASGGVTAFKFRDPEGHPLEFLSFRPAAIPDVWRSRDGAILGVDHSAMTVADVAHSIAFYEARGFAVRMRQINRGIEQARLDDVDRAEVDVVSLMPPGGDPPHLELLHYREPGTRIEQVADDDVLATRVQMRGPLTPFPLSLADPDGHRLSLAS